MEENCCPWKNWRDVYKRQDVSREETFACNRVRHAIRSHIISYVRPDGTFAARKLEAFSNQGAYASHGHSIVAKGMGAFPQLYPCPNVEADSYTAVSYTHLDVYKRQRVSDPFAFILSDADYASYTAALTEDNKVDMVFFNVKDVMDTYPFAKELEEEYIAHATDCLLYTSRCV